MGGVGVVRRVDPVLRKSDRVRDFVRRLFDRHRNAHAVEEIDCRAIKIGDRLRPERQGSFGASAGPHAEPMADKIELDLENLGPDRDRRRAESAGGHIERRLPAVIEPRGQRQPDLADDLGPEMQGRERLAPCRIGEVRPDWVSAVHGPDPAPPRSPALSPPPDGRASSRRVELAATIGVIQSPSPSHHVIDIRSRLLGIARCQTERSLSSPSWGCFHACLSGELPRIPRRSMGRTGRFRTG